MQPDPIPFILLIKECPAPEASKQALRDWLNLAALLNTQLHGRAVSESLIRQLKCAFTRIMQSVADLGSIPENKEHSQQLFTQVSDFYVWLNTLSGSAAQQIEEQWQKQLPDITPSLYLCEDVMAFSATGQSEAIQAGAIPAEPISGSPVAGTVPLSQTISTLYSKYD
ncbi:hypothetical protein QE250_12260 [Chromatiaceae bacterium AAb-1]|nr:hypothetical protein [Chromatiaceae bacterium AAb-1]